MRIDATKKNFTIESFMRGIRSKRKLHLIVDTIENGERKIYIDGKLKFTHYDIMGKVDVSKRKNEK